MESFDEDKKIYEEKRKDFSRRLKESFRKDKEVCKKLVHIFKDVCFLIGLCVLRQDEHDFRLEKYERCLEVSTNEDVAKA